MTFTTFIAKTIAPIAAIGIALFTFVSFLPRKGLVKSLKRCVIAGVVTFGVLVSLGFFWTIYSANVKFKMF